MANKPEKAISQTKFYYKISPMLNSTSFSTVEVALGIYYLKL